MESVVHVIPAMCLLQFLATPNSYLKRECCSISTVCSMLQGQGMKVRQAEAPHVYMHIHILIGLRVSAAASVYFTRGHQQLPCTAAGWRAPVARLHSLQQRSCPTVAATPVPHQMPATGSVCAALPGAAGPSKNCQAHFF